VNSIQNEFLDGVLCTNSFYFHILSFLVFKHDFIRRVNFTRIAASNTENDDVTNQVTHRIFNTNVRYSCAHSVIEIDEKSSHSGGF